LSAPEKHDLASIELLADLDENQRRDFEKSSRWRRFASDEQIIDQQSDSRDVYFIASGRVRVVNFTLSGKEVALEDLGAGQYFGELAAIDGRPRSSTVVALEDSDIDIFAYNSGNYNHTWSSGRYDQDHLNCRRQ